jgi:hypothetical protein
VIPLKPSRRSPRLLQLIVITPVLLAPFSGVRAADGDALTPVGNKRIEAVHTDSPPRIDGVLDESVWQQAAVIADLHQVLPEEYAEPSERTEFYLLYDKDNLYIAGRFWDAAPENITARNLQQNSEAARDDHMFVLLDPYNRKRSGTYFLLNANGVRGDGLYDGPQFLPEWEGIWHGGATITDFGWTAEIAIPMKTLSFREAGDTWGLNLARDIVRKTERISWVSQERVINPSATGELAGLKGLSSGLGLDLVGSMTLGERRDFAMSSDESIVEPSLDLFYKITPTLNGSLTLNTDFSATEVDDRQVNLTRFSLFFPEKRLFFLKDTDIFEFGRIGGVDSGSLINRVDRENGRPFFSRTIGLNQNGAPQPLDFGAKLSGRLGEWNLGALAVRQADLEGINAGDLFVGRVTRNVFAESTIGLITTYGDPQSDIHNSLLGADFRYRNARTALGIMEAEAWYQVTDTEGLEGSNEAYGARVRFPNLTGWRGRIGAKELQANFNPAMGFVSRRDIRNYTAESGYLWRPNRRVLREVLTGIEFNQTDNLGGDVQSSMIRYRLAELTSQRGDKISFRWLRQRENFTEPFEIFPGTVVPVGDYIFDNYGVIVSFADHRPLSGDFAYFGGTDFDGKKRAGRTSINWRPSKHFGLEGAFRYGHYQLPQGDFITRLMSLRTRIVFSNTLSWVNLAQYDNLSRVLGINSRLHWIPQAGRELFFVINHNLIDDVEDGFRSTNADVTLKINYTLRF